jgi:hypothetical protein
MIGSHANMVALANRLRVDDKNRGELESMRKDVFEGIYNGIRNLKKKQNPWRLTRAKELRTGSLYRGTAMKGSADIDVILLLNFQPQEDMKGLPRAKEILILIQSLVPKGYTAKMNKRSVTVSKNSTTRAPMNSWLSTMMGQQTHHSMDIVPALRRVGQGQKSSTWWYGVSKVSGPAQWLRFNPTHQKEMFSKLTKRSDQKDDPTTVIICLKHWRNQFRNPPCKLPSYVFEVLTWEDYRSYPSENDLTKRFNRILKNFKRIHNQGISFHGTMSGSHKPNDTKVAKGTPLLHDPSNTSQNLVKHLRKEDLDWWSAKAQQAANSGATFHSVLREW